ncbi:YcxB family protein [Streptomyces sp. NPDC004266]|uniref:YcxB family protein n=1 Tax=Streptomyces sp. NPDC004266 TaxID=3364693 RepID=UPI003682BBD2
MELVYTPTRADVTDAVRVQMRHGWYRWLMRVVRTVAVLAALVMVLELFGPGDPKPAGAVRMAGLVLLLVVLGPLARWVTVRQMYALIGRQGEFRARVDEDGVRWTTRDSEVVHRWQLLSRYTETPTQFVLLSGDKGGVGVAALPKRGLTDPAEVDRLRQVLERNATRL